MSENRIGWIDYVRVIAILTVLYIHATDGIYILSSDRIMHYTLFSRIFQFVSLFIGRIGVPLFLMITGYLLLDNVYDDEKVREFWNTGCRGLIIVTIIWVLIYFVTLQYVFVLAPEINVVEACTLFFSHMWYMPMIIGMYLSIPFVSIAVNNFKPQTIWQTIIMFSLLAFILPFITLVLDIMGVENVNIQHCLGFSGGVYGIYIILGWLVKKEYFKKYSSKLFVLIAIISFLICLGFQYYTFIKRYDFFLWYEFPFILTESFALFELCSRRKHIRGMKGIKFFSKYSFAVFLIHNLFRIPLLPIVIFLPFTEPLKTMILWILLIIFSYGSAVLIYRIPKYGKFILYMK